ncbi:MAG: carbohydrate-binding domain-containing protein [Paludibacteraceae bacterium]
MKKIISIFFTLMFVIMVVSCDPENVIGRDETDDTSKTETTTDYTWDDSAVNTITLNDNSISSSSSGVTISGTTATITTSGYYSISGNLSNGQLIVNAPSAEVKIKLNNATVNNNSTSPFYIVKASKVIVFLATGSTNTFTDASSYSNSDEPDACIFSNAYLAFTDEGTLNVNGKYADGISSDDQIIINKGTINVNAVDDGIFGKDYLIIHGGNITASCTSGHALKSNNSKTDYGYVKVDGGNVILASTSGKGIKAINKYIQESGNVIITKSDEGVESYSVTLNGGMLDITAKNDGINTTASTTSGGTEQNDGSNLNIRRKRH